MPSAAAAADRLLALLCLCFPIVFLYFRSASVAVGPLPRSAADRVRTSVPLFSYTFPIVSLCRGDQLCIYVHIATCIFKQLYVPPPTYLGSTLV